MIEVEVIAAEPTYRVTLSQADAIWLAALMQNPIIQQFAPVEEDPETARRRVELFTALDNAYRSQSRK